MTGMSKIIVIGLCGVTCSGKTSLTMLLRDYFKNPSAFDKFGKLNHCHDLTKSLDSKGIQVETSLMDDYFLPVDDPRHTIVPELNHINFELMTSLDIDKMISDINSTIERLKCSGVKYAIMIIEGFLIFNCARLKSLCDHKFFIDLDFDTCLLRRRDRVYDPPDIPGYFEKVVWPESQKNKEIVFNSTPDLHYLDGSLSLESNLIKIIEVVNHSLQCS